MILNKPIKKRSERELDVLLPLIKEINFFKERDINESDFCEIANCLSYEFKPAKSIVFEYGKVYLKLAKIN